MSIKYLKGAYDLAVNYIIQVFIMKIKGKKNRFVSNAIVICLLTFMMNSGLLVFSAETSGITTRIDNRDFPSVFQAWNGATGGVGLGSADENIAKHDLFWAGASQFGLVWNNSYEGLATAFTPASINNARTYVNSLKAKNPNIIIICEIRYYASTDGSYLPANHEWWKLDRNGNRIEPFPDYYVTDFDNASFRANVANQSKAVADLDFMDGVLIDCFAVDTFGDADSDNERVDMIRQIREKIGEKLLIINSNMFKKPNVAQYVNGLFMECFASASAEDWQVISETLRWANTSLREPRVNCLETWPIKTRNEMNKIRATTALSLTHGDGYCLFADSWAHFHDWYAFWDTDLGKPVYDGYQRQDTEVFQREFTKGTVIYNPKGNGNRTITFAEKRKSAATGKTGTTFMINDYDGDIFTYVNAIPTIRPPSSILITYNYGPSICSRQGVDNWYTQSWDGSKYTNMIWDSILSENYRYLRGSASVYGGSGRDNARMKIGSNTEDIAAKWVAPDNGNITITGPAYITTDSGDGVKLTIKKNDTIIWGPTVMTVETPIDSIVNTTVEKGDAIYCIANSNGSTSGDEFFWKLSVKHYLNITVPPVSSSPSSSSGNSLLISSAASNSEEAEISIDSSLETMSSETMSSESMSSESMLSDAPSSIEDSAESTSMAVDNSSTASSQKGDPDNSKNRNNVIIIIVILFLSISALAVIVRKIKILNSQKK